MAFFDIDDILRSFETFDKDFGKRIQEKIREMQEATKEGQQEGKWNMEQINEPGVKGYVMWGYFSSDKPLKPFDPSEPFKPLRPSKHPFLSEAPSATTKDLLTQETREPLTDVIEEDKAVKIYVELPGAEKDDIKLDITTGKIEIKAKNFHKTLDLPRKNIETKKSETKYKNGVLEITIPKKKAFKPEYHKI
jgi:HSP20 family molecular chaperone IbpA